MTTAKNPHDLELYRDRVRLYLQVMLIIDLCAYLSDLVTPLFVGDVRTVAFPAYVTITRHAVTGVLVGGWLFARYAKPRRAALMAFEIGLTLGLAIVYVFLSLGYFGGAQSAYGPVFALLGIVLLLVVRASLVPSPLTRTVVIGVAALVCFFVVADEALSAVSPQILDGLSFMGGAFVIATAATSHVIYGLRRQIRDAMQLGQYQLGRKLGEGGMGTVYQASHAMLRREAAIKLIRPELSGRRGDSRGSAQQRFEREAHVTAHLKSPHTVELYDFGVSEEGSFYYVMELLDGIDLQTAIEQFGPMAPERVVFLLEQLCESLAEAHAAGLVHRDIKPANVFICRFGLHFDFVKVLDFGLVALGPERTAAGEKLTGDGFVGGTPAYVAPEMVKGGTDVDGRADLYAVGCVAYWLLTGRAPFEGRSAMATILAHVSEAPPPPSTVTELPIPPPLEALVMRCLEKDPAERPSSAAELSGLLTEAVPAATWNEERARKWWDTHRPTTVGEPTAAARDETARVTKARR